jgi:hypothetical protein
MTFRRTNLSLLLTIPSATWERYVVRPRISGARQSSLSASTNLAGRLEQWTGSLEIPIASLCRIPTLTSVTDLKGLLRKH